MLLPLQMNGLNLDSATAVAVVSGTASSGLTEAQIVAGGETIVITLTNDTWVASGAAFNAQRQNIIDGLDSAQSETFGWNAEVRDKEVVGAVVRTSDTVVTITLTAAAAYNVTADETITVTVPATALTGATELTATPTIAVTADAEPSTAGGRSKRGKKRRYLVEVDGQFFDADNIAAVQSLLQQAVEVAKETAPRDAQKAPEKIRLKPPRIAVRTGSGAVSTSATIRREVSDTQKRVNEIYQRAQAEIEQIREIARLLQNKIAREEQDDEEAIIALLM